MLTKTKKILKFLVISAFFLIMIGFLAMGVTYFEKEQQVKKDKERLEALYPNILEGVNTDPVRFSIDFSKPIATGSPLIFGGNHHPLLEHQDAWNQIEEAGVTFIRMDINIERELPSNITLEEYKNNNNNIQNVQNWDQKDINTIQNVYLNAKRRNMQVMAIMSYSPQWLNHSNTIFGVPKNWDVYKDIVKKSYSLHRDVIDYIEIWNEPSYPHFLDLTNTNYTREEAYKMIFKTSVEAIREVDEEINDGKKMKIGGPVSHRPFDTSMLKALLDDPQLKNELDFISYHNYEADHLPEPSDILFRSLLEDYDMDHLPIFMTEWSYQGGSDNPDPKNTTNAAITYTGNKFLSFLKMGLAGANYHALEPINETLPNKGEGTNGFYRWQNGKAELLPQAKTWRLLSTKMSLGKDKSKIFEVKELLGNNSESSNLKMLGVINVNNQYGIAIVNSTKDSTLATITLNQTDLKTFSNLQIYYSSSNNDAHMPVYEGLIETKENSQKITVFIPKETVVGILVSKEKKWYEKLRL